jgi:hypothetical protein
VTEYVAGSTGDVAPVATINGSETGLSTGPFGIALDAKGNMYVANFYGGNFVVFAAGSNGNVAPISTVSGDKTRLGFPSGVALDAKSNIYIANEAESPNRPDSVLVYAAGSNGNVAPIATISGSKTGLAGPLAVALDDRGNLYVANRAIISGVGETITEYAAGSNGNVAPIATIATPAGLIAPQGLALDPTNDIYATYVPTACLDNACGLSLLVFPPGSNGYAVPSATIAGPKTQLVQPAGVALDHKGNIYVVNLIGGPSSSNCPDRIGCGSITEYAADSNGDVSPIAILAGDNTQLNDPTGIAIGLSHPPPP